MQLKIIIRVNRFFPRLFKSKIFIFSLIGKKRRLTIIECGCDINMMIDLAKVADLVSHWGQHGFLMGIYSNVVGYLSHVEGKKDLRLLKK